MARYLFPEPAYNPPRPRDARGRPPGDWFHQPRSFYTDAAATTAATISSDSGGVSVLTQPLAVDGYGQTVDFYGPDGVEVLYDQFGNRVLPKYNDRLDTLAGLISAGGAALATSGLPQDTAAAAALNPGSDTTAAPLSHRHKLVIANASDLTTTGAAAGMVPTVTGTGPLTFALQTPAAAPATPQNPTAAIQGLFGWTFDDLLVTSTVITPVAGQVIFQRWVAPAAGTVTNLMIYVNGAGATLANCYVALHNSSGTVLASSADISSSLTSTGSKTVALSAAQTVAAGSLYFVSVLCNGTTMPTFRGIAGVANVVNQGLTAAAGYRCGVYGSAQTAIPNLTLASATTTGNAVWVGMT